MIGDRIKELREERGILQRELADALKLTQQTISLYESNKREPDLDTINKIANYFGVSIDYLLCRTDVRNSTDKITDSLSDDPELAEFWDNLKRREDLQIFFKQTRNLSPKTIKQVMKIIKAIEDEEDSE